MGVFERQPLPFILITKNPQKNFWKKKILQKCVKRPASHLQLFAPTTIISPCIHGLMDGYCTVELWLPALGMKSDNAL